MIQAVAGLQQGTASGQFRTMFAETNNTPLSIIRPLSMWQQLQSVAARLARVEILNQSTKI